MIFADNSNGAPEPECPVVEEAWQALSDPLARSFQSRLPPLSVRRGTGPGLTAEMRFMPDADCGNVHGALHGGFLAAVAEQSLFLPLFLHGRIARAGMVVVDFTNTFMTNGRLDRMIHARIELMHETKRMGFVRGTLSQNGVVLSHYSATVRKVLRAAA